VNCAAPSPTRHAGCKKAATSAPLALSRKSPSPRLSIGANIRKTRRRYLLFIHAIYCLVNYLKRPFSLKLAPMPRLSRNRAGQEQTTGEGHSKGRADKAQICCRTAAIAASACEVILESLKLQNIVTTEFMPKVCPVILQWDRLPACHWSFYICSLTIESFRVPCSVLSFRAQPRNQREAIQGTIPEPAQTCLNRLQCSPEVAWMK
jgi:hypothetical protein